MRGDRRGASHLGSSGAPIRLTRGRAGATRAIADRRNCRDGDAGRFCRESLTRGMRVFEGLARSGGWHALCDNPSRGSPSGMEALHASHVGAARAAARLDMTRVLPSAQLPAQFHPRRRRDALALNVAPPAALASMAERDVARSSMKARPSECAAFAAQSQTIRFRAVAPRLATVLVIDTKRRGSNQQQKILKPPSGPERQRVGGPNSLFAKSRPNNGDGRA